MNTAGTTGGPKLLAAAVIERAVMDYRGNNLVRAEAVKRWLLNDSNSWFEFLDLDRESIIREVLDV